MSEEEFNQYCRLITKICRHEAEERGIAFRPDGFIKVDDLKKYGDMQAFKKIVEKDGNRL